MLTIRNIAALLITGGTIGLAGVSIGGYGGNEFTTAGVLDPKTEYITDGRINAFLTATGSTSIKYNAACIQNPLTLLQPSQGTGTVLRVSYEVGNNPAAARADVGFVKSCAHTASGSDLIDNSCTSSGCVSTYTTGTALWNSADYIKVTLNANPTASYTGRLRVEYADIFGE